MSQRIDGLAVYVKVPTKMLKELDRISERLELKRSELIRNMIDVGITVFHGYESVGIVKMHEINKKAKKLLKSEIQPSLFK